jgi:epoxide hydrolase
LRIPPENILGRDELLDNVMLYWLANDCRFVSAPILGELWSQATPAIQADDSDGHCHVPKQIVTPVRKWMEASYTNIQHWSDAEGRSLASFKQPELFVQEVRDSSESCESQAEAFNPASEIAGEHGP